VEALNLHGPLVAPVALPQLVARARAKGREEEDTVDVGEAEDARRGRPRIDVRDQHGPVGRSVALPELEAGVRMEGPEEERAVDIHELGRACRPGPRVDV